jgi:hypothetical protein
LGKLVDGTGRVFINAVVIVEDDRVRSVAVSAGSFISLPAWKTNVITRALKALGATRLESRIFLTIPRPRRTKQHVDAEVRSFTRLPSASVTYFSHRLFAQKNQPSQHCSRSELARDLESLGSWTWEVYRASGPRSKTPQGDSGTRWPVFLGKQKILGAVSPL